MCFMLLLFAGNEFDGIEISRIGEAGLRTSENTRNEERGPISREFQGASTCERRYILRVGEMGEWCADSTDGHGH